MTQGRPKGNRAELEVAALLQGWWRRVEPEANLVRTPLSGGWGKPAIRAGFRASGDIMTDAKLFPFVVEVKRREGWSWVTLLAGRRSPVWGYWRQTQKAALEMTGEPILIWRKNREPWWVMLREGYALERKLYTAGVDVRWAGRQIQADVGAHPRAFPLETLLAFPPSRFATSGAMVSARRRAPHGEKAIGSGKG